MTRGGNTPQALYRKYRSKSLDEILGQDHITGLLKKSLEKGRISHAYLLTGPRGTGKTSIARILAHEINQLPYKDDSNHLDIIEIDAASNNGVEDVRALREKAQIAPVSAKYKVYIIDEVHMLSKPAFNALLKILEEPPAHIVFILATTDADKLPGTILSRVQQYYFHPISVPVIAKQLQKIAKSEGFAIDKDAAQLIAELSHGGFRDSISLLDQLSSLASNKQPLTREQVAASVGMVSDEPIERLLSSYNAQDLQDIIQALRELEEAGINPLIITGQLLTTLRQRLSEQPEYLRLIQELIEVTKHAHPDLRLLTALTHSIPDAVPTVVKQQKEAASVKEPGVKYTPAKTETSEVTKKVTPSPSNSADKPANKTTAKSLEELPPTSDRPKQPKNTGQIIKLNWSKVLEDVKNQSMGLSGFLSACDYVLGDESVTLFAGKPFNKKKLEDSKSLSIINQAIQDQLKTDVNIVIKTGKKPPTDKNLAEVASIMGGGEEVSLEDIS